MMNHVAPTFVARPGLNTLLNALLAVMMGAALLTAGLLLDDLGDQRALMSGFGVAILVLGCYLLVNYRWARMIVSSAGLELVVPYRSRRPKELPWGEVRLISVHPSGRFVTFEGSNGVRIDAGPGAKHWRELLHVAEGALAPDISAPLRPFLDKREGSA